jgi:hypothetical protein
MWCETPEKMETKLHIEKFSAYTADYVDRPAPPVNSVDPQQNKQVRSGIQVANTG